MSRIRWTDKSQSVSFVLCMAVAALVLSLASCKKADESKPVQKTFASPAEAGTAFFEAAKSGDQAALLAIFGPEGKDVLFSGDPVKDKNALQEFVASYRR